jgi:hypothetical protein
MSSLVIGLGQIGTAVQQVTKSAYAIDIAYSDPDNPANLYDHHPDIDVLHICFPYFKDFVAEVHRYQDNFEPKHTIIWSTVPIGTSIKVNAIHSPVEGKHPDLELSLRFMTRWIGFNDPADGQWAMHYFFNHGFNMKLIQGSNYTEALKLFSTTEYGLNIEFARYKKHVADSIGMDYDLCKQFNEEYNKLYQNLGMGRRYQKYVLDAPDGPKGGHCVTPNAQLLHEQFPNDLVKIVGEL